MTRLRPATSTRSAKVDALAIAIDAAIEAVNQQELEALDKRCAAMLKASSEDETRLLYYRSNVQAALQDITDAQSWKWRQPHRERQILYLRRAKATAGFAAVAPESRAQILTNLANTLNSLGRSIEALQHYDQALDEIPHFAIALGNRGIARAELARQLHDSGHVIVLMQAAAADIKRALAPDAFWDNDYPEAIDQYQRWLKWLTEVIARNQPCTIDLDGFSLGRTKTEKRFRRWALENELFLSPLNVIGTHAIAAADPFGLPPHRGSIDEPPHFIAWYNQMKQEFAAARLLLFESIVGNDRHYADRDLMLVDTLDFHAFGLKVEKQRIAFRMAYGLLDKIAGFLNGYFKLGDDPNRLSLRSVWPTKGPVRKEFADRPNLPLRGLYWLSLDLLAAEPADIDAIAPDAAELNQLRNALEHRCVVLREVDTTLPTGIVETRTMLEFRQSTFRMMSLARAALFYLSLAVGIEERKRDESKTDDEIILSRSLGTYRGIVGYSEFG
jgi:tetratricopeptide (TPR) repeat protein